MRIFIICLGLIFTNSYTTEATSSPDQARYDNYRVYSVLLATAEQVKLFQDLEASGDSCTFFGHARHANQRLTILVAAHKVADFASLLKDFSVEHKILTHNFQTKIDKNLEEVLPKSVGPDKYDWQHYFHLETIDAWMVMMAARHNLSIVTISDGEGLTLKGLKLGHGEKKAIFIESGIHAREWIAPATATYIINELLTSNDTRVQHLANTYNWIILPVVNPEGYKYSFEADRMWRKNRANFGHCYGVDLNRNFPYFWNTTGTSGDPCRYDYSGPAAASEWETQAISGYLKANAAKEQIKTYLSLHSYSQMIMFPYGHTAERVANYADLQEIVEKATHRIQQVSGRHYVGGSIYETIYPSSGGSKDWAHGVLGIPITYTFELRGPPDSPDMFILPAVEILPTAEEAFAAIVTIVEQAEKKGYYS